AAREGRAAVPTRRSPRGARGAPATPVPTAPGGQTPRGRRTTLVRVPSPCGADVSRPGSPVQQCCNKRAYGSRLTPRSVRQLLDRGEHRVQLDRLDEVRVEAGSP